MTNTPFHLDGYCDPEFNSVKQAFTDNLMYKNELGAAISVVHKGQVKVDLWGGYKDKARTQLWKKNTLVCVMSVTKAIGSLCLLVLADKKLINLDAPVAAYWPEFAQEGKENITVRCVLAQLAGIPVADAAPANSLYKPGVVIEALAAQKPLWKPGTTPCYHSFTHGPFCQKMVELITKKSLGTFLREDLFGPLDIDFFVGLKPSEEQRCAEIDVSENIPSLVGMQTPGTLLARAWKPASITESFFQGDEFRRSEFASGNGHSNATALARLYGILAQHDGGLISNETLEDAIREQWNAIEKMTSRHFRYSTGFMLNNQHFRLGDNPRNFGHPGLGGPLGFADPDAQIGFGYCCNRIHPIDNTGPCGSALIDAVYSCL